MQYGEKSLQEFLDELASKAPVPGGGGVSALTGALAAGLAAMVCSLTSGKKRYADVSAAIEDLSVQLNRYREMLLQCVDADAECFAKLSGAYAMPKGTADEAEEREKAIEQGLMEAAKPPLYICELTAGLAPLIQEVSEKGSRGVVSDAGCAAVLARAAMQAARLNVLANTKLMKDKAQADRLLERLDLLTDGREEIFDRIYGSVSAYLGS